MKTTFGNLGVNTSFTVLTDDSGKHFLYTKLDLSAEDKRLGHPNAIQVRHMTECTIPDDVEVLELL